jgi:hypothetical protein
MVRAFWSDIYGFVNNQRRALHGAHHTRSIHVQFGVSPVLAGGTKTTLSDWKKTDVLATAHTDSVAVICERSFKEGIRKIA